MNYFRINFSKINIIILYLVKQDIMSESEEGFIGFIWSYLRGFSLE
jgi:ABC-type polysaccharide/polyol phosphate export permease